MMREGLRGTIDNQPDLVVAGEMGSVAEALEAATKLRPDLILTDLLLPAKNGLELIKDLHVLHPHVPVLVLSMHDESLYAERVLRAGARGYITKQQPPCELIRAIRQVLDDRIYVSERVSERIVSRVSGRPAASAASPLEGLDVLTDRELQIFELFGAGKTQREIAQQVHLSPKTVAVHSANIRSKLNLKTTPELIRYAVCMEQWRSER